MAKSKSETEPGKQVRIMLVDDHPVFRLGLRELIQQEKVVMLSNYNH